VASTYVLRPHSKEPRLTLNFGGYGGTGRVAEGDEEEMSKVSFARKKSLRERRIQGGILVDYKLKKYLQPIQVYIQ